ncbi:NUDIX hydrolase [Patescibacteria group bacterium]
MRKLHTVVPFVVAIIKKRVRYGTNGYLIGRHSQDSTLYPKRWDLPGGKVEEGDETPFHALVREVKEETGLTVVSIHLNPYHGFFHHSGKAIECTNPELVKPGLAILYEVKVSGKLEPDELEDMHWASWGKLQMLSESGQLTPWCRHACERIISIQQT